jgi:GT2 family glycosyltransferase
MIKASIIIPTYNRGKLLCNTLTNLIGQLPPDGEIVVVDQSDEVCSELMEIAKNHSTQIHYYKIFVKGLPHARNYGLRQALGEIVIFCDDDVIPDHNFIENHIQNYQEKEVGGVGGRIILSENQSPCNSNLNKVIGKVRWWDAYLIDNFDATERVYIDHVQGCNMSFRKEALIKAGGFDECFGGSAHLEETDLCLRIRKAGYKIVFDPKAELIHLKDTKGGCRAENYKQWFYWYGYNNMLFFLKNFSRSLLPVFIVSSFIRLLLSASKRWNPLIAVWGISGYWAGLADYKSNSIKQ